MLSERQKTAESLAREINRMGAWVINPMPLDANAKLRFQVLDDNREKVLEKLAGWDWSPSLCGTFPRICLDGMKPANVYEIDLPPERQPVADDRIPGEIAKRDPELEKAIADMLKACGFQK
jgi:hypothetical protein